MSKCRKNVIFILPLRRLPVPVSEKGLYESLGDKRCKMTSSFAIHLFK